MAISSPAMLRTMWCRKALAVTSIRTHCPRRCTVSCSILRTGDLAWHCEERKALKSCSPSRCRAGLCHAGLVQRPVDEGRARAVQRRARGAVEDQVAVGARLGAVAGVEVLGHRTCPGEADIAREARCWPPGPNCAAERVASVSKCATCPWAWTPVSVRPAHTRSMGAAAMRASAVSVTCCTVRCPSWLCQPAKALPSYSTPTAIRATSLNAAAA